MANSCEPREQKENGISTFRAYTSKLMHAHTHTAGKKVIFKAFFLNIVLLHLMLVASKSSE